jgi:hypothetical protein
MNEAISYFENNSKNKTNLSRSVTAPIPETSTSTQFHLTPPTTTSLAHTRSTSDIPAPVPTSTSTPITTTTQIRKINLLIPETLSKTERDLFLSIRVTVSQSLEDIRRGISPHLSNENIWFSLSSAADASSSSSTHNTHHPQEISLETKIGNLSNPTSSKAVDEFTLLIHPDSSRTLELSVQCQNTNSRQQQQQQPIKLIVKPSQTCRKMMEKIASHVGAPQSACSFTFNGKKLKVTDTFESLGVVNGSVIRMTKK